jgi:GntR family transcriptional regulator
MSTRSRDAGLGDIKSRIAGKLREAIRAGRYRPGDPLPSTNDLAEAEGAAPMTVRAAYSQLIGEGLVVAVPRKGFYVREQLRMTWHMNAWQDPRRLDSLPVDGWTSDVEAAGYSGRQTISIGLENGRHPIAGHTIGELLGLSPSDPVAVRYRMRFIGPGPDQPATDPESIADSYYPYDLVRDTAITDPESVNTAAILRQLGAGLHHYVDELVPRMATQEECTRLQLPPVTAVLELIRTGYTAEDRPVLVQHLIRPAQGSTWIYHVTYPETDDAQ